VTDTIFRRNVIADDIVVDDELIDNQSTSWYCLALLMLGIIVVISIVVSGHLLRYYIPVGVDARYNIKTTTHNILIIILSKKDSLFVWSYNSRT